MSTTPLYTVEALVRFTDVPALGIVPVLHYQGSDLAQAVSALTVAATSYEGANREMHGVKMTVQPGAPSMDEPVATAAPRTAFLADTEPLLVEDEHGTKYVGPFEPAQALVAEDFYVSLDTVEGKYVATVMPELPEWNGNSGWAARCFDNAEAWGRGDSKEEAWRYAFGALFGPIDAGYDEVALRAALVKHF